MKTFEEILKKRYTYSSLLDLDALMLVSSKERKEQSKKWVELALKKFKRELND